MLDKFVGQVIRLTMHNDSMSLIVVGTLAAVVGTDNYILRVKNTDVTIRFRVTELKSLDMIAYIYNKDELLTARIKPAYLSIGDVR